MKRDFHCPNCGYYCGDISEEGWLQLRNAFLVVDLKEGRFECPQCAKQVYWYARHHASKRVNA